MRAAVEKWLNSVWYNPAKPPVYLRAIEPLYNYFRAKSYPGKNRTTPIPIVVVGNISVGGTGKTPLVISLCKQLQAAGFKPAVISRGYGRRGKDLHVVSATDSSAIAGDEALLIKQQTGVPVLVDADRRNAAMQFSPKEIDIIIADDGLQNRILPRDMQICVVDGQRLFGNGYLLPAGPLRQPVSSLSRMDHIVVNGDVVESANFTNWLESQQSMTFPPVTAMQLVATSILPLNHTEESGLEDWQGRAVHAVAAIGNPDRFFQSLKQLGLKIIPHAFPDHHKYTAADFKEITGMPVVMTAKDAIKCKTLGLTDAWVLEVRAEFDSDSSLFDKLKVLIGDYRGQ